MKRIGIIGGIGPESTVDYYKEIISEFKTKYAELAYPEIIVYSVNLNELLGLVEAANWSEFAEAHERVLNGYMQSNSKNRRSFVALLFAVGDVSHMCQRKGLHTLAEAMDFRNDGA